MNNTQDWAEIYKRAFAIEKAKEDAACHARCEEYKKRHAEYQAQREIKSNGLTFEDFVKKTKEELDWLVEKDYDFVTSEEELRAMYDLDIDGLWAAFDLLEKYEPQNRVFQPDPEQVAQKQAMDATLASLEVASDHYKKKVEEFLSS